MSRATRALELACIIVALVAAYLLVTPQPRPPGGVNSNHIIQAGPLAGVKVQGPRRPLASPGTVIWPDRR